MNICRLWFISVRRSCEFSSEASGLVLHVAAKGLCMQSYKCVDEVVLENFESKDEEGAATD